MSTKSYTRNGRGLRVLHILGGKDHHDTIGLRLNKKQAIDYIACLSEFVADSDKDYVRVTVFRNNPNEDGYHTTMLDDDYKGNSKQLDK